MAEFNPYLAPAADITPPPLVDEVPGTQLWRDGSRLVMDKTASLPARCIVCNAPATGQPLRRRLTWHPSAWYLLLLINILVYAIVSLIGIFGARVVRATRIDATRLWLAGVSPELIAELPAWPSQPTRT